MTTNRPGRPEAISASVLWKIRTEYKKRHCQWGPTVLKCWCERKGLGSYSPTTIAKAIADLVPAKRKQKKAAQYEIAAPMVMWSQDATGFRQEGKKQEMMVLQDENPRLKLSYHLVPRAINEQDVLVYLRLAFETFGAPLILKQDNISYQNTQKLNDLCDEFGVILLNSPPGYPPYNGKKERSMRDIKSFERALRWDGIGDSLQERIELAMQDLNEERPRPMLNGLTARETFQKRNRTLPNRQKFKMEVLTRQLELEQNATSEWQKKAARRKAVEEVLLDYDLLNWKGDMPTNSCAQSWT